jgi:exoribonuclease R
MIKISVRENSFFEGDHKIASAFPKLFHGDVVGVKSLSELESFVLCESSTRNTMLAGVLVVGKTYGRAGRRLLYRCIPDNSLLPSFLVPYDLPASFQKNYKNKYIVFRFDHWDDDHPRGEIKHTLGDVDSNEAFEEYQLWRRGLHISLSNFTTVTRQKIKSKDVVDSKDTLTESSYINHILEKNREIEDLRSFHNNIFTIDPESCTDFDDAFSVTFEDRFATVNVYIANVYLWLETYALWEFVSDRVSTIYLPERKVPMLPPLLSDTLCSLKEGHDRFAFMMSIKYDMDSKQQVGEPVYKNVLIRINKNYVYEDAKGLRKNAAYRWLHEVATTEVATTEDSHEVVSFWMIKMNAECAKYLSARGKGGIFRGSSESSSRRHRVPLHLVEKYGKIQYENHAVPHAQLGLDAYVHITSPIRRLVDILNQILFMTDVSTLCQAFFDKWVNKLDHINRATKDIRRVQMDCELLALCARGYDRELVGVVFDKDAEEYTVYVEELKLVTRIKTYETLEEGSRVYLKLYVFNDEHKLCRKVKLGLIHTAVL